MSDSNYTDILLEDMNAKFDVILEAVAPMGQLLKDTAATKESMEELKADVKVIKVAITDKGRQLQDHEIRITALES